MLDVLDSLFALAGILAEIAILALLVRHRIYRQFPCFSLFIAECIASDVIGLCLYVTATKASYFRFSAWDTSFSALLQFAVLVELAWSVLRPVRRSLPQISWAIIVLATLLLGLAIWPLVATIVPSHLTRNEALFFREQQTLAFLRVIFFLVLAGFSQLLAIGWRDREVQIANGLGFYSVVSLTVNFLHTYQIFELQYRLLDKIVVFCYLCVLGYWVLVFAKKDVQRRKFTPKMANFLLYLGRTVKMDCFSVTSRSVPEDRHKED